jgi:hypothetical protein
MRLRLKYKRLAFVGVLVGSWLLFPASELHAQDPTSIFTALGKFVSGFKGAEVFFSPAGSIRSDELKERGELQQIGVVLDNPKLGITVGFDMLSGFEAKEESLNLRGSIIALPTVEKRIDLDLPRVGNVLPTTTLGFGLGLSQLQDVRTEIPQTLTAARAVKANGSGYHVEASASVGVSFGDVLMYVGNSLRYTRFPSIDWIEEKSIVPPAGWPTSMDLLTSTVRIGIVVAAGK